MKYGGLFCLIFGLTSGLLELLVNFDDINTFLLVAMTMLIVGAILVGFASVAEAIRENR